MGKVWSTWTSWANTPPNFWRTTNTLQGVVLSANLLIDLAWKAQRSPKNTPLKIHMEPKSAYLERKSIFQTSHFLGSTSNFPKSVCPTMNFRWNRFPSSPSSFFQVEAHDAEISRGHRLTKRWGFQPTNLCNKYALLNWIISPRYYGLNIQRHIFETT